MKLTLGFSPCPNDTFIFDALVNKKIDTQGIDFDVVLADVQTLNEWALQEKLAITKISFGVLPLVKSFYTVLNSGAALGKGVGPLLVSNKIIEKETINNSIIAIPGKNTTAHVLFSLAFPDAQQKKFMVFYEIENAIVNGEVDAGVIIHENRFTYQQKGLKKIMDLGEYWEQQFNLPIPLGGIVASNKLNKTITQKVDHLIQQSVEYAFLQLPSLSNYIKMHAQEMEELVMKQHIQLYVNNYSKALGTEGKAAIKKFLEVQKNITISQ